MGKPKTKKLKRLKKGHILPSVLFLLITFFIMYAAAAASAGLIITYFAKDRLDVVYNNMIIVGQMFSEVSTPEEGLKVLNYLEKEANLSDAVFLLDGEGNRIYGFGEPTYDLDMAGDIPVQQDCKVYADSKANYGVLIGAEEFNSANVTKALVTAVSDGALDLDSLSQVNLLGNLRTGKKRILYQESFWMGMPIQDGMTALVKGSIYFYAEDIALALLVASISMLVMLLPILFLFISLVSNVIHQGRMSKLLYTDPVTNGKSWLYFEHHVDKVLRAGRNAGKIYALVDLSLMKYRGYCTCHGVEAGEQLLANINKSLTKLIKRSEYCARFGKSSYALLLKCDGRETCEARVNEIIRGLQEKVVCGGMVYHAGIYFAEPLMQVGEKKVARKHCVNVAEFYNRASAARASLTDDNNSGVAVFDKKLLEEQLWEHKVGEKMQKALENEEFQVYIQPKYNPVTEKLAGAEALVRWINDEDGFISPGRFIPIFEKNGFITKLDDYMISHVAKLQAQWIAEGKEVVPISVNVSRAHFANPDLAKHICSLVDAYQLPHHLLEIELTESAFFDDKEALLRTVRNLKEMGFDISMDDFGAGYSSLNSLKDLPLDVLKLDAEFFRGEDGEERGEIVVSQAIDLAKKLNMRIVAEGVEKKNQVEFLAKHDCDMIQGYYFAKPMPAGEYADRMGREADKAEVPMIEEHAGVAETVDAAEVEGADKDEKATDTESEASENAESTNQGGEALEKAESTNQEGEASEKAESTDQESATSGNAEVADDAAEAVGAEKPDAAGEGTE